jgi:choline dehydrogenase-like flavoprotein
MEVRESNNIGKGTQEILDGVVDENGKFLDQEFIYACDLSIFPTSPAANPSLTAVALALRLSDRLVRLIRSP